MISEVFYEIFAGRLEAKGGVPDGRTEEFLRNDLETKHKAIFEAIDRFKEMLIFQDKDLAVRVKNGTVDRINSTALYGLELSRREKSVLIPFTLKHDGVKAASGPIFDVNKGQKTEWSIQETEDFIDILGEAILEAYYP